MRKFGLLIFCVILSAGCGVDSDDLNQLYLDKKGSYPLRTHHLDESGNPLFINRLIKQSSPYLLQHAHNPVDWWAWGDEAFSVARETDKPVLLSIGYSTCHWCHVMERESFEDLKIAEFINQHFIPIKVDREEHPDVDELYISAVQKLSGQTGWPLTAVLTPEGLPFFGGTYFPPQKFQDLLERISSTWVENRDAINEQAERVRSSLQQSNRVSKSTQKISDEFIEKAQQKIAEDLARAGGPQAAFPREPEMLFVLQRAKHNLKSEILTLLNRRLDAIANGGIHDQLGGGFHRYTVGSDWQIPHFEKMLYNQAQLAKVYLLHYQLSADPQSLAVAESTLDFMLTEMRSKNGGFFAAMDAESEGAEGTFYVWSMEQLSALLSEPELELAKMVFGVSSRGNFEGKNVLSLNQSDAREPEGFELTMRKKLLKARQQRQKPPIDTKIITAWNSMAISSLVTAYQTTNKQTYLDAASSAAELVWEHGYGKKAGLARIIIVNGASSVEGVLDDYAHYANALLDLYDQSGDRIWLTRSTTLAEEMLQRYFDENGGSFKTSSKAQNKNLIVDLVNARDDAVISGNSMAAQLMMRLYRRTGLIAYRNTAKSVLAAFSEQILKYPHSLSGMLHAASLMNNGEPDAKQYAAKSKVIVHSTMHEDDLLVNLTIEPGWHINSYRVLENDLIPSELTPVESHCASVGNPSYPTDHRVSLGFQEDELLVFEGDLEISAKSNKADATPCRVVAAKLRLQACSDKVCMEPETLQIRAPYQN